MHYCRLRDVVNKTILPSIIIHVTFIHVALFRVERANESICDVAAVKYSEGRWLPTSERLWHVKACDYNYGHDTTATGTSLKCSHKMNEISRMIENDRFVHYFNQFY